MKDTNVLALRPEQELQTVEDTEVLADSVEGRKEVWYTKLDFSFLNSCKELKYLEGFFESQAKALILKKKNRSKKRFFFFKKESRGDVIDARGEEIASKAYQALAKKIFWMRKKVEDHERSQLLLQPINYAKSEVPPNYGEHEISFNEIEQCMEHGTIEFDETTNVELIDIEVVTSPDYNNDIWGKGR